MMQQYGKSRFADRFAEVAADSDYSSYAKLQRTSQYDIRAAAEALWQRTRRAQDRPEEVAKHLTGVDVINVLTAQVERYDDDNEMVSVNYEGYWDWTDKLGLSSGLRQRMQEELAQKYLAEKRAEGFTTVSNQWGVWLYRFED